MLSQTAASFVPSALEAMSRQSRAAPAVTSDHVAPASPESHMFPLPTTAASVPPSALDVMDIPFCPVPTVVHDAPGGPRPRVPARAQVVPPPVPLLPLP